MWQWLRALPIRGTSCLPLEVNRVLTSEGYQCGAPPTTECTSSEGPTTVSTETLSLHMILRPMNGQQSLPVVALHLWLSDTRLADGMRPTAECGFLAAQPAASSTMIYTTTTWRGMHGWQSLPVALHLRLATKPVAGLIRPTAHFGSLVAMTTLATKMIYITMTCRPISGWKSLPVALHPRPALITVVPGIQ